MFISTFTNTAKSIPRSSTSIYILTDKVYWVKSCWHGGVFVKSFFFVCLFFCLWNLIPILRYGLPTCCCCLVAKSCLTLWDPLNCSTPGFPVLQYLPEFAQIHAHWISETIQPSHSLSPPSPPLSPPSPPGLNLSQHQGLFKWGSSSHRLPKYWSFSFSISPSNENSGLISFRMDWFDLLAVQGTLKSLLQYHSSKASIHWHSAFFTVQLSHPYMTTGKNIALKMAWTSGGSRFTYCCSLAWRILSVTLLACEMSATVQ